jgi:hypothetical protein
MAKSARQPDPPRWLKTLKRRVAKLDTARDWLRVLLRLQRWMLASGLIAEAPMGAAVAIMTRAGDVGQVGGPYDTFIINLSAPDAVLVEQFKQRLKELRRKVPSSVAKRGPAALNADFGEDQFRKWRDLRIVEFYALLIWRERQPVEKRKLVTLTLIGEWTERYGSNDQKRTRDALKGALAQLPALAAQAGAELSAKLR